MDPLIDLVTRWVQFSSGGRPATVESFAAHILATGLPEPPPARDVLGFQLGLLFRFSAVWEKKAFADLPLRGFLEFGVLVSVGRLGHPRKTDVVKDLLVETSTGFEAIRKLSRDGLIAEVTDSDDQRSVRLKLTPLGRRVQAEVDLRVQELTRLLLGPLGAADMAALHRVLLLLNTFHQKHHETHRNADWEAIRSGIIEQLP